ncbi:MAG: questin oxidase family protein [Rubrivivax sp.]
MTPSPTLRELLDQGAGFDAEYGDALSDHRPMALVALERLGADAARLRAFAAAYEKAKRLRPARAPGGWVAGDIWTGRLGDRAAWPAYRDLFRQWLGHEGVAATLHQVLPALMPGCAAAAFHGPIRVAYALQAAHAAELADGLAHWAAFHQPLGELAPMGDEPDPRVLLRRLRAGTSSAPLITGRIADAARGGAVNRTIAALRVDEATPERLARAAAFAYAATGNFTALHLVTATHAMRVIAPFVDEDLHTQAWRWFWQAWAHGVVAARLQPRAPAPLLDWAQILPRAIASDDEHVVKLVDSAREEERAYGGGDWRAAASRAVA